MIVLQLILAALGYTTAFEAQRPLVGVPVLVMVAAVLYLLATPESRLAYLERGHRAALDQVDDVGDGLADPRGPVREPGDLLGRRVEPVSTRVVSSPASMPATTSVSIRSPTMAVVSEWASMRFMALRNIIGFGLPPRRARPRWPV